MAGFKAHITVSTALGLGYGVAGHHYLNLPPDTCVLAAGLCSVAGMLPDLDSDSGTPLRESLAFGAAVVPMLLVDRWQQLQLPVATMVLLGGLIYLAIRFGVGYFVRRYTVHRGMFHSIPALGVVALLGYLVCASADERIRYFHSLALASGFFSHLLLDEIWSLGLNEGRLRIKSSFGTALKFWGPSLWGNVSVYAKLIVLGMMAFGDPILMERFERDITAQRERLERTANETIDRVLR
jgi:hypothetical protein